MIRRLSVELTFTLIILLFFTLTIIEHVLFSHFAVIIGVTLIALAVTSFTITHIKVKRTVYQWTHPLVGDTLAILCGALLSFFLFKEFHFTPVLASAVIGLIGSLLFKSQAPAIFCGSFIGMTSPHLFTYADILMASLVCGILYSSSKDLFKGLGGKLGTLALIGGTSITLMKLGTTYPLLEMNFDLTTKLFSPSILILIMSLGAMASHMTNWIDEHFAKNIVLSSSLIGLLGALLLPLVFKQTGHLFAVVVYCASFAGMTSSRAFKYHSMYLVTGLISGFLFYYSIPILVGLGGKLGTIGFVSSMATVTLYKLIRKDSES
ncbi:MULTISPECIES: hypothetical protein [unclassified Fusibacter]|uniref:hypothetical protein n=1 Tax=unclassified Fusibacter TaxID=2624464 RepID=UPI0010134F94|nr:MULTISPECIES: hypothetical protein [unclassified Fusibacter]MCK8058386.1 hypothetical protein [Fusibacter sp. A2]NPE20969.1 hypothetical protein [Fusibacter sp. A1]RXV63171.1 hypothetical protein DWB64_03965 [Fusibacter sp. A1]